MKLKALCCMLFFCLFLGLLSGCSQKDPMETAMEQIESTAESIGEQIKDGISTGKDQVESMLTSALGGESMDAIQEDRSMIRNKYKGAEEYEFEIHTYDGRILSFDQER